MRRLVLQLGVELGAEQQDIGGEVQPGEQRDDGAKRASEVAIAGAVLKLDVWTPEERTALQGFASEEMSNWRKINVGSIRSV